MAIATQIENKQAAATGGARVSREEPQSKINCGLAQGLWNARVAARLLAAPVQKTRAWGTCVAAALRSAGRVWAHVARRARNPQDPRIDAEDVYGHGLIFATSI